MLHCQYENPKLTLNWHTQPVQHALLLSVSCRKHGSAHQATSAKKVLDTKCLLCVTASCIDKGAKLCSLSLAEHGTPEHLVS